MAKDVIMPVLGMNQDTAVLLRWLKHEGDRVEKGEPIMEVETDKATMELDAPASGTLANVTAGDGDEVKVGSVIAVVLADGEALPATGQTDVEATAAPSGTVAAAPGTGDPASRATQAAEETADHVPRPKSEAPPPRAPLPRGPWPEGDVRSSGRVPASPKARRLAEESGVALTMLRGRGSGPDGAVLAADVMRTARRETGPDRTAATSAERRLQPLTIEREVDATELVRLTGWARERGASAVTAGDVLARLIAAVSGRHRLIHPAAAPVPLAYRRPVPAPPSGAEATVWISPDHQTSLQAIASARAAGGADDPHDGDHIALIDLTNSRLDRVSGVPAGGLVTVVAGGLRQRLAAHDGQTAARDTLMLTLVFDGDQVDVSDAAAWADRLIGLIETPSDLLILY